MSKTKTPRELKWLLGGATACIVIGSHSRCAKTMEAIQDIVDRAEEEAENIE